MEATEKKEQHVKTGADKETGKEAEKSTWEKAAELIAGDNKTLETLMKIVLSPLTLVGGLGLLVYFFIESRNHKKELEKLKEENKTLSEDYEELKDKYKKWKKMAKELEAEKSTSPVGFLSQKFLPAQNTSPAKKTYHSNYLDYRKSHYRQKN